MHAHRIKMQLYNNGQRSYFNLSKYWRKCFQASIIEEGFSWLLEIYTKKINILSSLSIVDACRVHYQEDAKGKNTG